MALVLCCVLRKEILANPLWWSATKDSIALNQFWPDVNVFYCTSCSADKPELRGGEIAVSVEATFESREKGPPSSVPIRSDVRAAGASA